MLYLRSQVRDLGLPEWANRLTPLVEFNFSSPTTGRFGEQTIGTINPGIIWSGQQIQLGIEAIIPATRGAGKNIGVIAQVHFYLDDIFPEEYRATSVRILSHAKHRVRSAADRMPLSSLLRPVPAGAHAFLSQAVPPVGGVVPAPPREIRLTFSEGIEPAFSRIELARRTDRPIGTGPARVDPRDNTQLVLAAAAPGSRPVSGQMARRLHRYAPDRGRLHL